MSEKPLEKYFIDGNDLETREAKSSDFIGQIAGYAIKFNKPSTAKGPFTEYIAQTALNGVDMSKVLALYGHDYDDILGRVDAGTLSLNVDKIGLYFVLDLPDTTLGRDVYANIKAGNLKGMSFGFKVAKGGDTWKRDDKPIRVINKIDSLREISVVSVPAYDDTSVLVTRSLDAFLLGEKERNYKAKVKEFLR
ncbi:HK97 family phage prohead protease [Weissella paramesenteroides]|uniref:HK97 family phage prohead protease n=1 Tax=Weissella paramesenteroides TaxID=1249 RepID=UPI0023A94D01|nr:HK97 family phage prohead protease [Weissella paramesenteroides]WEA52247.1 HK97 family phage prohead protease [Weissella paramesenteroides]